jgi:deoxycytidylate deaminase
METAIVWSKESYCERRKVGAVVERDGHILDTGYNGTIKGADNCCEDVYYECNHCKAQESSLEKLSNIPYNLGNMKLPPNYEINFMCKHCDNRISTFKSDFWSSEINRQEEFDQFTKVMVTNDFTIHAEQNIISNCAKEGISLKGATMYITTSPCKMCAKLIAGVGIVKVYYAQEYKDLSGVNYLNSLGIKTERYSL